MEASVGFTAQLFTQGFVGSTTIVPRVSFWDYFWLFSDPLLRHMYRYFQAGSVAAYEHVAMIKCHYRMADALDECIAKLSNGKVLLEERPIVTFHPLKPGASPPPPPPIAVEDVPNVVPRIAKDVTSGANSFESLTTVDDCDYDDESNWMPI